MDPVRHTDLTRRGGVIEYRRDFTGDQQMRLLHPRLVEGGNHPIGSLDRGLETHRADQRGVGVDAEAPTEELSLLAIGLRR